MKDWNFGDWLLVSLGAIGVVVLVVTLLVNLGRNQTDRSDKRECHATGGKVDHYDDKHEEYWRCVKQAERAP